MIFTRWMNRRDWEQIFPKCECNGWTPEEMQRQLAQRDIIGYVAEEGDTILAWCLYQLGPTWIHIVDMGERRGEGEMGFAGAVALVEKLEQKVDTCTKRKLLTWNVPDEDLHIHLMLHDMGWHGHVFDSETYQFLYGEIPVAEPVVEECATHGTNRISHLMEDL